MKNQYEIRGNVTAIFLKRKNGTRLEALISTSDLEKVNKFTNSWCPAFCKDTKSFYVNGKLTVNGKRKLIPLHRWIFDEPKGKFIDHINHDTLDNTRENLRIVTPAQNSQNRKPRKTRSGVRGVSWNNQTSKWHVRIDLGFFEDIREAERVVIEARKKLMPFSEDATEEKRINKQQLTDPNVKQLTDSITGGKEK